ncbi:hypothetical protein RJZ90_003293 [Blastomyces dermatitidis]
MFYQPHHGDINRSSFSSAHARVGPGCGGNKVVEPAALPPPGPNPIYRKRIYSNIRIPVNFPNHSSHASSGCDCARGLELYKSAGTDPPGAHGLGLSKSAETDLSSACELELSKSAETELLSAHKLKLSKSAGTDPPGARGLGLSKSAGTELPSARGVERPKLPRTDLPRGRGCGRELESEFVVGATGLASEC